MATLNLDPGIKMPDYTDYSLISPIQQDAANKEAFVQSRSDYAQSISMPGPDIADIINEVNELGARTDALLAKGNPQIPSFGTGMGYQSDFNSSMSRGYSNFLGSINSGPSLQSKALGRDLGPADDLERFTSSDDFTKFGYVPSIGAEQEYRYGRDMSWGETIGKALSGGTSIAADTFIEGWKGWGRMAEALFTWDASKLMGSREERYEIAKKQEAIFNKYAIFNTPESEESLLNRQFFGNMVQQTGFTVGALAQIGAEFWLGGLFGRAISAAVGIGKARALTTAVDVGELINDTRKASNLISNTERVTSAFKNLAKSIVPLYGTAQDLFKASKAGAGAVQLGLIGLGGIKRELSIFNMARSEAIFEAASTYKDLEDKLTKEFVRNNERQPNEQELERIRSTADRASSDNFYTNTGILSVMNRIQFGNMFKGFNGTRKLFGEGLSPFAKDVFEVTGKAGGKTITKVYEKGFMGRFAAVPNIAKTFGSKKAAWEASKSIGLGLMKFEGSEGVQELLQDASNRGLSDYYYDLYHGKKGYGSKMDRILESVKNPLTDLEGAKTFLMGALTGRLIAPFSYVGRKLAEGKNGKEISQRRKEAIDIINTFYNDPTQYTKEWIANVKVQNRAAQNMEEAAANGDRYTFYNTKDSAFAKAVASAIKLNMYDSLKDTLTEMGRGLTDEEFKEAFKMEASKDNRENVTQFVEKVVKQIDEYHTLYNNLKDKYGDRIAPELYRNNKPEEYERVKIAKIAQDNAIEMLTTNVFKSRQATRRAAQIQAEIAANPNIGSSSTEVLTKLGSEQAINDHARTLEQEIAFYEKAETLTQDQKEIFKLKKQELKLVQAWQQSFEDVMTGEGESYYSEGAVKKIYQNFENLVNFYNKTEEKGISVSTQDIEDVFTKFLDYIQLNKDSKAYVDAMNLLADPYNMNMIMESMKSSIEQAGKKMQKEHLAEVESIKTDEEKAAEAPKPENKPPDQPSPAGASSESANTKSGTPENTGQQTAEEKLRQIWFSIGNGPGRNALEDGWAESFGYINETLSVGGENYQAHGMGKSGFAYAIRDLFELFNKGIDSNRGGGQLYTGPLAISEENKAAASALGTAGGTAYTDGAFVLVAKKGIIGIKSIDDIGGILVNHGLTDINSEILTELRKAFPNLVIESYKNAKGLIEQLNKKSELADLQPAAAVSNVEAKKADAQTVKNRMQEIEKTPVAINITQDAEGKMEQTSEEVISSIKSELDKIGLPYSDVVANDKGSTYFVVTKDGQQHEILRLVKTGNALVKPILAKAKWINHLIKTQPQDLYDFVNAELATLKGEEVDTTQEVQTRLNEDLGVTSKISIDAYLNGLHYVQTEDGKYYVIPDSNASGYEGVSAIEVTKEQIIKPFRTEAEWKKVGTGVAALEGAPVSDKIADIERRRQEELISAVTTPISYEEFVNTKPSKVIVNNFDVYEYDKDLKKYVVLGASTSTDTSLESIKAREESAKDIEFFKDKSLKLDAVNFFWSERIVGRSPVTRLTSYKKRTNQGRIDEKVGQTLVDINAKYDAELAPFENTKPIDSTPQTYADQFDLSTLNTEPVTSDIVDEIMSSTQSSKSDNFDNSTEDFFSTLTSCNL